MAPNATLIGNIFVARDSYFGFGSVAQALDYPIRVG